MGQHGCAFGSGVSNSQQRPTTSAEAARLAEAVAMDDDSDDWDPVVTPGVVLRPHLLQWKPCGAGEDELGGNTFANPMRAHAADPLHDPDADDEDGKWVARKLLQPDGADVRTTAAVLNCPGCFTPVCYQCQKHDQYARQWRAVEVRNCTVDRSVPLALSKGDTARYFPVKCEVCNAEVGLQDADDVYHLFHVLESAA